jgi:hypothetical protein
MYKTTMKPNTMFATIGSPAVTIGLPLVSTAFLLLGMGTYSIVSQLFFSVAAVVFFFAVLVLMPSFFERYSRTRVAYMRKLVIQEIRERATQRQQYFVLSAALRHRGTRAQRFGALVGQMAY